MACISQLAASTNYRFAPLPSETAERFNKFVSEFATCKGTPDEIIQELRASRGNLSFGGRTKLTDDDPSINHPVLTIQNLNFCGWGTCKTHFFKGDPGRGTCKYVFSANVFKGINPTSSFLMSEDDKYHSDCEVFFNGVCSIEENLPWRLYVH